MPERASTSGGLSALQHSSGGRNGSSFHGCLRNLYVNGKLQDLGAGLKSGSGSGVRQGLGQGVEPGCQPCQRGVCVQGDCHPTGHRGFTCTCHPGWTGALCDQQVNNPCDGHKWVLGCLLSLKFTFYLTPFILQLYCSHPSAGVSTEPANQSTPTLTPVAASLVLLVYSVIPRTRKLLTPAVLPAASMANAEFQVWETHTASVTVDTQGRPVTEVRKQVSLLLVCLK